YDPIRDFAFVSLVSGYPMVVATAPNSPINSFADLIARAKAAPFSVTYGMNLPGSVHHLTGELINVEAGTSLRGIPYRGNTQIVQDLLGGRLDIMIETGTIAFAQINGGTLRGLAVSSRKRFALEPHRRSQGHREVLSLFRATQALVNASVCLLEQTSPVLFVRWPDRREA